MSLFSCRNHSKPHLRPTIPTADRSAGLLDNPGLFPSFPTERLNGIRSSPPTRLPSSQPRTRLPSTSAFPRRDTVGTGRVTEPTTTDYALGIGRGRYDTAPVHKYFCGYIMAPLFWKLLHLVVTTTNCRALNLDLLNCQLSHFIFTHTYISYCLYTF